MVYRSFTIYHLIILQLFFVLLTNFACQRASFVSFFPKDLRLGSECTLNEPPFGTWIKQDPAQSRLRVLTPEDSRYPETGLTWRRNPEEDQGPVFSFVIF